VAEKGTEKEGEKSAKLARRRGSTPTEDRRIALDRQSLPGGSSAPNDWCRRMTTAINVALHRAAAPHSDGRESRPLRLKLRLKARVVVSLYLEPSQPEPKS